MAVYSPGASGISMQDSSGLVGGIDDPWQLSFAANKRPLLSRSSRVGSAKGLGMPELLRLGPIPRTSILALLPEPRMKPAIATLSATPTRARVLTLRNCEPDGDRSYNSTKPTPVVPFFPANTAVY